MCRFSPQARGASVEVPTIGYSFGKKMPTRCVAETANGHAKYTPEFCRRRGMVEFDEANVPHSAGPRGISGRFSYNISVKTKPAVEARYAGPSERIICTSLGFL